MSLPSLLDPPILFAHRGGRAHASENTMAAFELGLRLGATGLESDAWLTADGVVVLDHNGRVRSGMRRRAIARCARAELPDHIPTLADLYATCGSAFHLSLDVKDKDAFDAIVAVARAAASDGLSRLWLCHPNLDTLVSWRDRCADVRAADTSPPFFPPFFAGALLTALPRPEPLFLPPPVVALTVAQARRLASSSPTPRLS